MLHTQTNLFGESPLADGRSVKRAAADVVDSHDRPKRDFLRPAEMEKLLKVARLSRFGLSTKHLPRYLAWMRLMTWGKDGASSHDILTSALGRQVINL